MGINLDKPERWKEDIARSVDQYNNWFLKFAPKTYREERVKATEYVAAAWPYEPSPKPDTEGID